MSRPSSGSTRALVRVDPPELSLPPDPPESSATPGAPPSWAFGSGHVAARVGAGGAAGRVGAVGRVLVARAAGQPEPERHQRGGTGRRDSPGAGSGHAQGGRHRRLLGAGRSSGGGWSGVGRQRGAAGSGAPVAIGSRSARVARVGDPDLGGAPGDGRPAPVRHVVVVGGGIAGLAAAWSLRRHGGDTGVAVRVTVLEGSAAARRQAAGQRPRRRPGRRGRGVAAAAPSRGRGPGGRRRARPRAGRDDQRTGLEPGRAAPAARGTPSWASPRTCGQLAAHRPADHRRDGPHPGRLLAAPHPAARGRVGGPLRHRPDGQGGPRPAGRAAARRRLRRPGRPALPRGDPAAAPAARTRRTLAARRRPGQPRGGAHPAAARSSARRVGGVGRLPEAVAAPLRRRDPDRVRPSASCAARRPAGG